KAGQHRHRATKRLHEVLPEPNCPTKARGPSHRPAFSSSRIASTFRLFASPTTSSTRSGLHLTTSSLFKSHLLQLKDSTRTLVPPQAASPASLLLQAIAGQ